jgi:predicted nucleic acid-binding protein
MKGFLDTSVLIAVFYGDHIHHDASLNLFTSFGATTGCCGSHSLAEVYSTLTRMPANRKVSPEHALVFVRSIQERLSVVPLTGQSMATRYRLRLLGA